MDRYRDVGRWQCDLCTRRVGKAPYIWTGCRLQRYGGSTNSKSTSRSSSSETRPLVREILVRGKVSAEVMTEEARSNSESTYKKCSTSESSTY